MNSIGIGNRIIILGCAGSGKSTFAKRLHEYTGLPLIHLDNVWWNEDQTHISREEFDHRLDLLLQGEEWIIDGDYSRTYEVRIQACNTIIFLDYSEDDCMKGIMDRVGKSRSDIHDERLRRTDRGAGEFRSGKPGTADRRHISQ